jgi:spermine oxidase
MAEDTAEDGHTMPWKTDQKVIIIGAGIAGIAAGNTLANAGFDDFLILEATDRIGGRIWSVDLETVNGQKAEMGANWIHGIDKNPIYKLAVENNLLKGSFQGRKLGKRLMFLTEKGEPINSKIVEEVDWLYGMLMAQCEEFYQLHQPTPVENDSVGAFLEREFDYKMNRYSGPERKLRKMILAQRLLGESVISGCHSLHEVALSEIGCFEELPGVHYIIPPGFESVVGLLKENIPADKMLLNHPVTQISWSENDNGIHNRDEPYKVCVQCENGKKFYAHHVIVTIPLGYLKKHARRIFNPPLPEHKMEAINHIAMGTVNKVVMEFDGPVLPPDVHRLEMVWDREQENGQSLSETWHKKIGSFEAIADNVLVGWLCGREAEFMETISDEDVSQRCVEVLKTFLKNFHIPNLKRFIRSKWKTEPYTCGSYCFIPVGAHAEDIEALAEPITDQSDRPLMMFAGEATHTHFYSSSHGALLTGQREAQRLLDLYQH